jgi:hypothetical protein
MDMKLPLAALIFVLAGSSAGLAQQPVVTRIDRVSPPPVAPLASLNSSTLSPSQVTPDIWFYLQEQRRHDDPAQAVRRKAEYQAAQRTARLASAKWYGYSNSRPETSPIPTMGHYSTSWSGNGLNRYEWIAAGTPYIAISYTR